MQTKSTRAYHRGYAAMQNKISHKVYIYNTNNELFYSCKMEHKASEEDLVNLIDALVNYRKRLDLWN